ncbi:MAG: hypothetical protein Q7I99_04195 [Acholeplasmataceae bacterium]|nr:hypothetical protein [Acholeplasmataceae bacterium]
MLKKKFKKTESQSIYSINPDTNAFIVEISLEDYSEIFNGWDASPLRRKDMEPELIDYLEQAATEIPPREKVEVCFYLPKELKDIDREQKSITAIKNNFKVVMFLIDKTLKKNYRQLATYIILSILFLIGAYALRNLAEREFLLNIAVEGLFIGGWILSWEAFNVFFFDTHESRIRMKLFKRYLNSEIYFKDTKE